MVIFRRNSVGVKSRAIYTKSGATSVSKRLNHVALKLISQVLFVETKEQRGECSLYSSR